MAQAQLAKDEAQLEQASRDVTRYTDLVSRSATPVINLDNAKTAAASSRAAIIGDHAVDRQHEGGARLVHDHRADLRPRRRRQHQGGQHRQGRRQFRAPACSPPSTRSRRSMSRSRSARSCCRRCATRWRPASRCAATPQGATRHAEGKLALIDNTVDPATGTIVIRAQFDNADELLWPGQLCNLTLTLREEPNTVVVPREAIQISQNGNFVFTVKDGVAHVTPVTVGRTEGADTVVDEGPRRRREGRRRRRAAAVRGRQGRRRASPPRGRPDEPARTLHPPAGDDQPADAVVHRVRPVRLQATAGFGAAARRFPDHRGQRLAARREPRHDGLRRSPGRWSAPSRPFPAST